jgi:hypothetical protein
MDWGIAGLPDTPTLIYGGRRMPLPDDQWRGLRLLIRARMQPQPAQLPELHGYVRTVDLMSEPDGRPKTGSSIRARAIIRRLRSSFSAIGLDDMVEEHKRFGYRLVVPPHDFDGDAT